METLEIINMIEQRIVALKTKTYAFNRSQSNGEPDATFARDLIKAETLIRLLSDIKKEDEETTITTINLRIANL